MTNLDLIAAVVKQRHLSRIKAELNDNRSGIHVTDLVYPCMLRSYFTLLDRGQGKTVPDDEDDATVLWIGKKIHDGHLGDLGNHEYKVQYKGIAGSIDEVLFRDDETWVIDLKTTRRMPTSPLEQHVLQIEYYITMYANQEKKLDKKYYGVVLYIDIVNNYSQAYAFEPRPFDVVDKELVEKYNTLKTAYDTKTPPKGTPSWLCRYCHYYDVCEAVKPYAGGIGGA